MFKLGWTGFLHLQTLTISTQHIYLILVYDVLSNLVGNFHENILLYDRLTGIFLTKYFIIIVSYGVLLSLLRRLKIDHALIIMPAKSIFLIKCGGFALVI